MNPKFYRPVENEDLLGSAAKAKEVLGWEPKYGFEKLVEEMVLSDIELVKNGKIFSNTNLDWLVDESGGVVGSGLVNEPTFMENRAPSDGDSSAWAVDESQNAGDPVVEMGKGSDQSVAGSEHTEDSGIGGLEKPQTFDVTEVKCSTTLNGAPRGLDSVGEAKALDNNGGTDARCSSLPSVHLMAAESYLPS